MEGVGSRKLRQLLALVNFGWSAWALLGGIYFLIHPEAFSVDPSWERLGTHVYAYEAVGISLLLCAVLSFFASILHRFRRSAAIVCALWCGAMALFMQFATPEFDAGDIYAWLLLMCSFTCVCRWALLVLEPYVCE